MKQNPTTPLGDLAKDIVASYEARVQVVENIVEGTHKLLDEFQGKREEMAKELRDILAKSENLRKKDFGKMMEDIVLTQQKREENVKQMLADFRTEEEMVVKNLRLLLGKGENLRIRDFKKMLARIREEQEKRETGMTGSVTVELAAMRREVGGMLNHFKQEREAAATEWKKVVTVLAQKRAENPNM